MFDRRQRYKGEVQPDGSKGNPMQLVLKIALNSGYGICGLKPIDSDTKYVAPERKTNFIQNNFNHIKSFEEMPNGQFRFDVHKQIDTRYNRQHCAMEVLSMSKVIMNEPMVLAEDMGIDIAYQDTDSVPRCPCLRRTQPEATSADHGRPNDGTGLDKQPPPVCTSSLGRGCPDRRRPAQGRLLGDGAAAAPRAANRLSRRARSTIGADRLLPPPAAEPRRNQLHGACMCHGPAHAAAGWRRPRSTAS